MSTRAPICSTLTQGDGMPETADTVLVVAVEVGAGVAWWLAGEDETTTGGTVVVEANGQTWEVRVTRRQE